MVGPSEEIPLNRTNSETKIRSNQLRSCYDSAVDESERRLLNVNQHPTVDCTRLRTSPQQKSPFYSGQNDKNVSPLDLTQQDPLRSISNLHDINAMSVASIYDQEHNEIMDADNDIYNDVSFSKPHARASCERDSVCELKIFSETSKSIGASPVLNNHQKYHHTYCESCYSEPPEPTTNVPSSQYNSSFFDDGERSIDFVIVWRPVEDRVQEDLNCVKRAIFEENLVNEGLELERDSIDDIHFTKIHTPIEVLRRYSEILKLRMPMKESLCSVQEQNRFSRLSNAAVCISNKIPGFRSLQTKTSSVSDKFRGCCAKLKNLMTVDEEHFPQKSTRFTAVYSRDKEYLFDVRNVCFFTPSIRSRIVQFILDRKRFTLINDDDYAFGINRLIGDGTYRAAYPLHDGEVSVPGSVRHLLYTEWASVSKWYRYQPLDCVKDYFGVKIGLYFAWLGFYTYMLLLASIVGFCCFLYAVFTLPYDIPSQEICSGSMSNTTMCPLCDGLCDYWPLKMSCMHIKVTYLFDNRATVFFAVFMSFWATLFLELWKRYSAEITHRWDLTGFDVHEEHPRPQYLARLAHVKKERIDYITNTREPDPPFWRMKLPAAVFSFSIVMLLVALALAAVVAVVIYRMSTLAALTVSTNHFTTTNAIYITTITAALINLSLIFVFSWFYIWLAEWLTEYEILRTQTEFDDSLTLKIYLFQFVNYYASIFYIAFFKGKFIGRPGQYNRIFDFRQEECGFGGCITELCIQLAIIMIGKQAMNTVLEMLQPRIFKYYNSLRVRSSKRKSMTPDKVEQRCLRDLSLVEWGPQSLFNEYLEMVLQYGFVTIFVAAFPLAPFFALLNNILEMRFDAQKLLKFHRRPVTQRVRDIGVWYRILDSIGKLSVITNGFIIAFTSEFIPRTIYQFYESNDQTLNGYVDFTLSVFNTSSFNSNETPKNSTQNPAECRYADYRYGPGTKHQYAVTYLFWIILAARLGFVLVFENFVAVVMIWIRWAIPDMSCNLRDKIRREAYITNEIIIQQEAERARKLSNVVITDRLGDDNDVEPDAGMKKAAQLMSSNLRGSQLDLFMHGEGDPFAPGHALTKLNENDAHEYELNKMFLESEKTINKPNVKMNLNNGDATYSGSMTETTTM